MELSTKQLKELENKIYNIDFKPTKEEQEYAKKVLNVDYDVHPQCVRCVLWHTQVKGMNFEIGCKPLPKDIDEEVNEQNILQKLIDDPVIFAKAQLNIELRHHQREMLRCTAKRRVFRLSRRAGKTFSLAVYAIWRAFTKSNQQILFSAPREDRVYEFFEEVNRLIRESEIVRPFVERLSTNAGQLYRKKPYEFRFTNGSVIRGFTLSEEEGGTQARGRSGDVIILDEADYISRDAIVAFLGILGTSPNTEFLQASTPAQTKGFFWAWCNDPMYKEFHWKYQHLDIYNPKQDEEWRRLLSKEEYEREVLAEFQFAEKGVFNPKFIERALEDYPFENDQFPTPGMYSIGVDWNESVAGVHVVIVRYENTTYGHKIRVTNVIRIPPSEFTQLNAVEKIQNLFDAYNPVQLVVDEGYGNAQIQMLKKIQMERQWKNFEDRFIVMNFGSKIRVPDLQTGAMIDIQAKPFMVSILSRYLENNQLILPRQEDYRAGLVGQMRNYEVESVTERGIPKYSKDGVHTLEAFMLQLFGLWKNAEIIRLISTAHPRLVKPTNTSIYGAIVKKIPEEYKDMKALYQKRRARRYGRWFG